MAKNFYFLFENESTARQVEGIDPSKVDELRDFLELRSMAHFTSLAECREYTRVCEKPRLFCVNCIVTEEGWYPFVSPISVCPPDPAVGKRFVLPPTAREDSYEALEFLNWIEQGLTKGFIPKDARQFFIRE